MSPEGYEITLHITKSIRPQHAGHSTAEHSRYKFKQGHLAQHVQVQPLGGRAGGTSVAYPGGCGDSPPPYDADGRPLRHVVGQYHCDPVVCGHMLGQLISVGKAGGRAAPDDTKMLD